MEYIGGSKRPQGATQFVAPRQALQPLSSCFYPPGVWGYWLSSLGPCLFIGFLILACSLLDLFSVMVLVFTLDVSPLYFVEFIHTCHFATFHFQSLSYFRPFLVCTSFGFVFLFSFSGFAPDRFCQFCCLPLICLE